MKKIFSCLLIVTMILSLVACGKKLDPATDPDLNNVALLTQAAINDDDNTSKKEVNNDIFNIIGNRASDYDFTDMSAIDFTKRMGIGWNLGNTLDALGGDGINPISQETSWGNPETTQELFKTVANYGFTTVRIPVTWTNFTDSNTYEINEEFLQRVKKVVDMALEEGLFVIINQHHECDSWFIPTSGSYEKTSEQLCKMWTQVGNCFADYDERLIFEGMNEPRTKDQLEWVGNDESHEIVNKLGKDFVNTIRGLGGKNSTRFLMVPCYAASSDSSLWKKYEWPEDERVIMSIHAYMPYDFALNVNGTSEWNSDLYWDTKPIDDLFSNIHIVLNKRGKAAVIGEMGCMSKNNNIDARVANVSYFAEKASFYKIPFIWWDNGAFLEGETFGLIDRNSCKAMYPQIIAAMFNKWYKSEVIFDDMPIASEK